MLRQWFQRGRRQRLLANPFPGEWDRALQTGIRHYRHLPAEQLRRVQQIVPVMLAEKEWAAAVGFEVTEAMRLAIAGQAAVMASGQREPHFFDRLHTIVIQPRAIRFSQAQTTWNPHLPTFGPLLGVAWHRGPVLISWSAFDRERRGQDLGHNVVLHEFAHHLDGLNGDMDGAPLLASARSQKQWYAVTEAEFLRLVGQAERDEITLLDHYGATNRAEFFAVATECFFELPHQLRERHRALYDSLSEFYRQDPAVWMPRIERGADDSTRERRLPAAKPTQNRRAPRGHRRRGRRRRAWVSAELAEEDAVYLEAVERLHAGRPDDARHLLNSLLREQPRDEEALAQRAIANFQLGRLDDALADGNAALVIDPGEVDALCIRGEVQLEQGQPQAALADFTAALAHSPDDAEARVSRARCWLELERPKKALGDLNSAAASDPYNAEALWLRGVAYEMLGRRRQADADFTRALLIDPQIDAAD